jgi:hypothetical protein
MNRIENAKKNRFVVTCVGIVLSRFPTLADAIQAARPVADWFTVQDRGQWTEVVLHRV